MSNKIVNTVVLTPLVLLALGVAYCEFNKSYWDYRVKEMCEKDGGVTIYEKVELTPDELNELGGSIKFIRSPDEKYAKQTDKYVSTFKSEEIRHGYISINRYETKIYKRSNKELLAVQISYGRIGGDFPTSIIHPSSFSCSEINNINMNILTQIFSIKSD